MHDFTFCKLKIEPCDCDSIILMFVDMFVMEIVCLAAYVQFNLSQRLMWLKVVQIFIYLQTLPHNVLFFQLSDSSMQKWLLFLYHAHNSDVTSATKHNTENLLSWWLTCDQKIRHLITLLSNTTSRNWMFYRKGWKWKINQLSAVNPKNTTNLQKVWSHKI